MRAGISLLAVCLFSSSLLAADEAFTSGLKHSIITNAVFSTEGDPLSVINTGYSEGGGSNYIYGTFGASIHLGAVDAGVIVSFHCDRIDGSAMDGVSYGTVGGITNALIGSVTGERTGYGNYPIHVDFSPIGATSYTYQLFFHDLKTLVLTNAGPDSVVDVGNSGANNPRINPIWLNGSHVGVSVDFDYQLTDFHVPGFHAYASRMVILAENPTNIVEQVSRVDVFGRNGLPAFTIQNERLGKFGLYHQALGNVRFHVTPSQLTVSNIDASVLQGMLTELPRVQTFRAAVLPRDLTNETFLFLASFTGLSSLTSDLKFLGDVLFSRQSNGVSLSATVGGASEAVTRVFASGVLAGSIVANDGEIGTIHGTNFVLTSYAAAATQSNEVAYIGFRFTNTITLSNAGGTILTGDELRVSTTPPDETIEALTAIAFTGLNLDQITITEIETFAPPPEPLRLKFIRDESILRLSWPYSSDFDLVTKADLADPEWQYAGSSTHTNSRAYYETSGTNGPRQFFQLKHYYSDYLFTPLGDD